MVIVQYEPNGQPYIQIKNTAIVLPKILSVLTVLKIKVDSRIMLKQKVLLR